MRSQAWIRLRQDVYADARLDREHTLVCKAVALRIPPGVLIAGPSAAYLHGIDHAATFTDDVHILSSADIRVPVQRGVRIHVTQVSSTDIHADADPPLTTPERTAWDTATWLPTPRAVAILDTMLRQSLLKSDQLPQLLERYAGRRGSKRARTAFDLADGGCPNPTASHLRTRLVQAGIPKPHLDHPVTLTAGLIILPDLAWPTYQVAVEYTNHRLALLTAAGWLVIFVSPARTHNDFPNALRELRQALTRRGWKEPE